MRFFGMALAALLLLFGWRHCSDANKSHLKQETYLKHLKRKVFLTKLKKPLPHWMREQIEEDFKPFEGARLSSLQVEATFQKILSHLDPKSYIVRYRIFNNRLYRFFLENEPISLEDNSTEKAIKTLLATVSLPDMDFLLSYFDGVPLCDITEKIYTTSSQKLQAPLFFSAKQRKTPFVILIPDWRSIGHWWISDIKHVKARASLFPWEKKREFALWRGSLTKPLRLELCRIAAKHPNFIDAKLNVPVDDPFFQRQIEADGLFGGRASWEDFLECKYLPYVDGVMCAAPALQWRLLSRSVILKPDSEEIQWFYRGLAPYVHYIPVKGDLSDLIDQLEWAKKNDRLCRQMGERAFEFAQNHLMYEDVLLYFTHVLKRYASMQKIDRRQWQREMRQDARWVNIHSRKALAKEGQKKEMNGYTNQATPF